MSWRVEHADALGLLRELPDGWAQCVVTSPPYWGLRDYGLKSAVWDGAPGCRHVWGVMQRGRRGDLLPVCSTRSQARLGSDARQGRAGQHGGRFCQRCDAWQGCLGLEPTPELYLKHLLTVLGEVHRVLRDDGTLWLVLGDSFTRTSVRCGSAACSWELKPKDLCGVPWRVAFALQEQGWWLRSDVVWAKPNAMPENVRDRPTRAHEYLFLLAKQPRYFYDASRCRSWWKVTARGYPGAQAVFPEKLIEPCILAGSAPTACGICGAPWQRQQSAAEQWRPGCEHNDSSGRCLILDPFCGSATTGVVADRHGRDFLGIELNPATARLARHRLRAARQELAR